MEGNKIHHKAVFAGAIHESPLLRDLRVLRGVNILGA
jgi:hypothetical protein